MNDVLSTTVDTVVACHGEGGRAPGGRQTLWTVMAIKGHSEYAYDLTAQDINRNEIGNMAGS